MPPVSVTLNFATAAAAAAFLAGVGDDGATVVQASPPAPAEAPAAAPKAARQRKAPEAAPAPVAAPAAAPAAPAASAPPAADLKKDAIAKLVTLINANDALGRDGKKVCTDLCLKFGGRNISQIAPDKYPAVIKEVEAALVALNEESANDDPTA